jgi:type VI secretion system secreted protein VgrG
MGLPLIQVGGNLLQNSILHSVEVVEELNHHWGSTIVCPQTEGQRLPVEELLGRAVEIKIMDDQGVELHPVFGLYLQR